MTCLKEWFWFLRYKYHPINLGVLRCYLLFQWSKKILNYRQSFELNFQLILEYNGILNEVWDLSLLTTNMCPLELGKNIDGFVGMVHV